MGEFIQFVFQAIHQVFTVQPICCALTPPPGGSVPGPETLLAFGLGFAAFVVWRAKRVEE